MSDTKMLQTILNTVVSLRQDVQQLDKKIDTVDNKLTKRLDKIGSQLAYLEDDTPTIYDHNKLKRRVRKLELKVDGLSKN